MVEDRLSDWAQFKLSLAKELDPLSKIAEYWKDTPLIAFNHAVDPYNHRSWPTPWEIISDNKYDDLTLAIMIGYTIKLIDQYKNNRVEIRTMVDSTRTRLYNLIYVDNEYVLNYESGVAVKAQDIPESFLLDNLVELDRPR
jgi:hypothetical protein